MKGIMSARTRPLRVIEPQPLDPLTEIVSFSLPPAKKGVTMIDADNAGELVRLLHDEKKLI